MTDARASVNVITHSVGGAHTTLLRSLGAVGRRVARSIDEMEGACLDHQNSTIFKSGEMAFCADDRLGRQAYSIRPSDRDSFQQVQRRYSVAQATIRAVSPDWEDAVTALKPLRAHDEADMSLPLSPPPSAPSSDAVSMSSPAHLPTDPLPMTEIKSLETLAPKSPDRQKRPDVSPTLDRSRKALLVRSRTKTLEERPPRPPCQVFALSPSDSVPPPQPSPHPPSLDRARADSVVSPFPLTGNNVNGAASETRKLRRNRQRSINNPSGPPPPPPPAESSSIIKVGKLSCWAASASISSSTSSISSVSRTRAGRIGRRARAGSHRWQAISAVLRDNGELKLFDETEITVVSVVRLSKLSRRAVQQLHPSVLDERFGIAIYPQYAISLSAMIPIRPIYLALDSRIQFEAWWALLRAFAVPELFGPDASSAGTDARPPSSSSSSSSPHIFRLERSVFLRIVEARVRPPRPRTGPEKKPSTTTSSSTMTADDAAAERYFVEVCMDGVTRARTLPRPALADLFWREDFDFADLPQSVTTATAILKKGVGPSVSKPYVEHPGTMAREESGITVCGTVTLDLEKALHHDDVEGWYPALDKDAQMIGDMFLRLRVEELVVLTMQEYSALSEVLHRHSSGLVALIARVLPKRLQRLSEIFVNIYQVSGHLDRWLKDLAETEIEAAYQKSTAASSARSMSRAGSEMSYESSGERELLVHELGKAVTTEVNLLFRGNSLLTRSMDFYMRRLGKDYLEETLRDVLTEINSAAIDCEVDPTRVHSPADLSRNWSSLVNHFRKVWMTIHESASRCPREMRLLLRHIRSCCDERFGTLHHTVRYSSVSGFLFLRFFCPAVLNPKLFGLLPGMFPNECDRRGHDQPRSGSCRLIGHRSSPTTRAANIHFDRKESAGSSQHELVR